MANQPERAWLTPQQAANALGVTAETVRRWIRHGQLAGTIEPRRQRDRYFVDAAAVDQRLALRGVIPASAQGAEGVPETTASTLEEVSKERDRYRAEAAKAREVALRLNAAMDLMRQAAVAQEEALAEQREAIALYLTPDTTHELGEQTTSGKPA